MKAPILRLLCLVISSVILLGLDTAPVFPSSQQPFQSRPNQPYVPDANLSIQLSGSYISKAHTTLADIDGDGKLEIIIGGRTLNLDGSLGCSGLVYVYRANGSLMWQAMVRADINSAAAAYDLNGDGFKDLVVGMGAFEAPGETSASECGKGNPNAPGNGGVIALSGKDGSTLWIFNTQDWGEWGTGPNGVLDGVYSAPAVGDMLGNGQVQVVFGAWDDCIYLLDSQGKPLWGEIPFTTPQGFCGRHGFFEHDTVWSSPALADLDHDGQLEIVIGGDISCTVLNDPNLCNRYNVPDGGFLWVIKYDGTVLARRWFDQAIYSSPAIADLNNDGTLDIAVGTGQAFPGKGYYVTSMHLDTTRPVDQSLVTNWQTPVVGRTFSSPAIADLNGDGIPEVVQIIKYGDWGPIGPAADNGSYVYAFRGNNGSVLWKTHACDSVTGQSFPIDASPVVADITGNSYPNILFPHAWEVAVLNSDGTYYTKTNMSRGCTNTSGNISFPGNGSFSASVAVGDLSQNGTLSIVAPGRWNESSGSLRGSLYVWNLSSGGATPWPMFHHDARHTGFAGGPQLKVTPPSIYILHQSGDSTSEHASITIQNIGTGSLNWSMVLPSGVSATSTSGTTSTSSTTALTISTNGQQLGVHTLGNATFMATSGATPVPGSPTSIPITLNIVRQVHRFFVPFIRR